MFPPHHGIALIKILNRLLRLFSNVQIPLIGEAYIGVKYVHMIFELVDTPPALHRGVEPTCCLSYGLFRHTHVQGDGLPVGILGTSQEDEI